MSNTDSKRTRLEMTANMNNSGHSRLSQHDLTDLWPISQNTVSDAELMNLDQGVLSENINNGPSTSAMGNQSHTPGSVNKTLAETGNKVQYKPILSKGKKPGILPPLIDREMLKGFLQAFSDCQNRNNDKKE